MTMTQDVRVLKLGRVQEWEQECVPASGRAGASTAKHKPGWSGRVWAWDELQGRGTVCCGSRLFGAALVREGSRASRPGAATTDARDDGGLSQPSREQDSHTRLSAEWMEVIITQFGLDEPQLEIVSTRAPL